MESIRVGDVVVGVDLGTGKSRSVVVEAVHSPFQAQRLVVINGKTRMTESHPLLRNGQWVSAADVVEGDMLSGTATGTEVFSATLVESKALVYNFQVEGGNYVADGIVMHNKEDCLTYTQYCHSCPPN